MRLTRKETLEQVNISIQINGNLVDNSTFIYAKLGQLEDIEEEIGIDLLTLFKMLKNGFYIRTETGIIFIKNEDEWEKLKAYNEMTSEYGKTWALTKEELI